MDSPDVKLGKVGMVIVIAIVAFILWLIAMVAYADGPVLDPNITQTKVLNCEMPVTRTDGTTLALGEIATVEFYNSGDSTNWVQVGQESACQMSLDLTKLNEGQYYYTARVTDTQGRQSANSNIVPFVLQRIAAPSPPGNLGFL